jgi:uncharacterized phage protein gp47/JayE
VADLDWGALIGAKAYEELVTEAFERLRASGSRITNLNVGGVARTLIELCAQGLSDAYGLLLQIAPQGFAVFATGAWLRLHAQQSGVEWRPATRARGAVRFARASSVGAVTVYAGTRVQTEPGSDGSVLVFLTIETVVSPSGAESVVAEVEAELAGARYNVAAGQISRMGTSVPGVSSVANEEGWLTREGADDETDDSLRERRELAWTQLSYGITEDRYRSWALEVPGVADALVDSDWPRNQGTVDVYVVGAQGAPTPELLADVQAHLDARRLLCLDVLVKAPEELPVAVELTAWIPEDAGDADEVQAAIEELVRARLAGPVGSVRLGVGLSLWPSDLIRLAGGVAHVYDVAVAAPAAQQNPGEYGIVTLDGDPVVHVLRGTP